MSWGDLLLVGLALLLIFEGVLPLLAPRLWRETMQQAMALTDGQLRFLGLLAFIGGLLLLLLVHFFSS
ncbi:MAG: DUF2065 domain-containing protein [Burkholderiales bacterium]|jgi:uncharacterized protein YjeT (DUF2065 family)|nr:DUF2065 domain-containing protein [Nitrosomonadaceae bacterium]